MTTEKPIEPKGEQKAKGETAEQKRRKDLAAKGSASASANIANFFKNEKKEQNPEIKKASNRLLKKILCEQWYILVLALPLSFLGTLQDFATSHFIGQLLDAMADNEWDKFDEAIIQWICVVAAGAIFSGLRDWIYGYSGEKIGQSVRARFFESILRKDVGFFDDRKEGDILSRLTSDTMIIQMGLTTNVAMFLKSAITVIGVYFILFVYNWSMTLIAIAFMLPLFVVMPIWTRLTQFSQKQYQEIKAESSATASETIGNIKTVKAFSGEKIGVDMFVISNEGAFNIGKNMAYYYAIMMLFFQGFFNGGFIGVAYFASQQVKNGNLSVGKMSAYLLYNWQILFNIMNISTNLQQIGKVQGSFYEIAKLIEEPKKQLGYYDNDKQPTQEMINSDQGTIDFKSVKFSYPTKPEVTVLKNIDIEVKNCTTVALVGHSGCGKSSIIALIERFYDPDSGQVLFNNKDIQEIDNRWYHQEKLAIVQQEPALFSSSIRENVLYGFNREGLSDDEVENRLKVALDQSSCGFLDDTILFPNGLNTLVGERGGRLSGGQKQRIAIARALIRRPRILLLDEATSALDAESEHQVQQALNQLLEEKMFTVVVIAHRLSTIVNANKIIVMKKGDIIETGTHSELLALDGSYKKLVSRQLMTAQLGEQVKK